MLASVIAFFVKRPALIGLGLMALVIIVQTARLDVARHGQKVAHADLMTCRASLDQENASVALAASRSAAARAQALKGVQAAAQMTGHLAKQRAALHDYTPAGPTACARWEDADAHVREALK
jgi:hypothetical protein